MVPPLQIPSESSMKEDTGSSITQIPLYQSTHELQQLDTLDGKWEISVTLAFLELRQPSVM